MEQKASSNFLRHLLVITIIFIPALYTATQWSSIPETIPTHFDRNLQPDAYGSKSSIWYFIAVMTSVSLIVYWLIVNIHRIDPKRVKAAHSGTYYTIAAGVIIFIAAIETLIILKAIHPDIKALDKLQMPLLGLLFIFLGNYMYNVKPNYFVGIRLPWTLASDYNWRKTHHLGGRLFFYYGIAVTVLSFVVPVGVASITFTIGTLIVVIIIAIYSYRIFRNESKNKGYYDKEEQNTVI